ncbi:Holliday junction resolvase RuvX [Gammaproteobacteria bacterium]|nr:Holliday junction resolvase RuvX [Gammaproteobacteria bacterium]
MSLVTLIAFDFGTKRIGVAVGQTITCSANPLETISANKGDPDWSKVDKLIKTWKPDGLIVGVPLNMDGSVQPLSFLAEEFSNKLKKRYSLEVIGVDERLSTVDARDKIFQKGGFKALKKGNIDSVAAQLILQNWLIQQDNNN